MGKFIVFEGENEG